jgi:hypothetical protein
MPRIMSSVFLAALLALCLHVASAQAQYVHTCVSAASGNDANTCHCTQPCRTFQRAHDQTISDGQITVLDPGDYGGLTITKSISINNDSGGEASITVSGGTTGIIVNAPAAGYVNLRGITIQGVGFGGGTGLRFNSGFSLTMTNCVVRNHTGNGITFQPSGNSNFAVSNTLVADNGGGGIMVSPFGSGTVKAVFNRVEVYNNSSVGIELNGVNSTGRINATVADSVAAGNGSSGFVVLSLSGMAATNLMVVRSVAANNGAAGLVPRSTAAILRVGQSTVTGNTASWLVVDGGVLQSYGDNNIDGNGDGDPAIPTVTEKK